MRLVEEIFSHIA